LVETSVAMAAATTIGHMMVPKEGVTDIGECLGDENWEQYFDVVLVERDAWHQLDRGGVLEELQRIADGILSEHEEAWFKAPDRLAAVCREARNRVPGEASTLLAEVIELARIAASRGSVVIFAS
jgi:hypothetical protein